MDQLSRLDGSKIFAMSRRDLIAAFGKKEGIRLDSQITISRNNAGKEIIVEEWLFNTYLLYSGLFVTESVLYFLMVKTN